MGDVNVNVPKNQSLVITRYEYRLVYSKTGRARYISHLDLMRTMQRTFKRAKIPLWYTQGFNPHAYLMFPLALSLGTDSNVEILDIALTEEMENEDIKQKLNSKMPEGLSIISVGKALMKHTEIKYAEYRIHIKSDKEPDFVADEFEKFVLQNEILIEKKTKKKEIKKIDIKPHIEVISIKNDSENVILDLILPTGNDFNLNANVVIDAFGDYFSGNISSICIERTKILTKSREIFA